MTSRDDLVSVYSSCAMCTADLYSRAEYIHTKIDPTFILLDA